MNGVKLPKRLSPPALEEQAAFDKLREQLCHPPILAIPRKEGKYIIEVDSSYDQLGCCLLLQQPDNKYQPVGYFSKGRLPAEKNETLTEIVGLGVVWAVGLLRRYIEGTKCLIRCDHRALRRILVATETACIPLGEVAQKQGDDEFCQDVKRSLDTTESTRFYQNSNGLLCREEHRAGSQQLLIPRSLVKDVLRAEHSCRLAAHPYGSRMDLTMRNHDY